MFQTFMLSYSGTLLFRKLTYQGPQIITDCSKELATLYTQ